eukprot:2360840-Alexandrium_andersonii.AAC.1
MRLKRAVGNHRNLSPYNSLELPGSAGKEEAEEEDEEDDREGAIGIAINLKNDARAGVARGYSDRLLGACARAGSAAARAAA